MKKSGMGSPKATGRSGGAGGGKQSVTAGPGKFAKRVTPNKSGRKK